MAILLIVFVIPCFKAAQSQTRPDISTLLDMIGNVGIATIRSCSQTLHAEAAVTTLQGQWPVLVDKKQDWSTIPVDKVKDPTQVKRDCIAFAEDQVQLPLLALRLMISDKPRISAALRDWYTKFDVALVRVDGTVEGTALDLHELDDAMKKVRLEAAP